MATREQIIIEFSGEMKGLKESIEGLKGSFDKYTKSATDADKATTSVSKASSDAEKEQNKLAAAVFKGQAAWDATKFAMEKVVGSLKSVYGGFEKLTSIGTEVTAINDHLKMSFKVLGIEVSDIDDIINRVVNSNEAYNLSNRNAAQSLAILVNETKDVKFAFENVDTVFDAAAATGRNFRDVAIDIAKAYKGEVSEGLVRVITGIKEQGEAFKQGKISQQEYIKGLESAFKQIEGFGKPEKLTLWSQAIQALDTYSSNLIDTLGTGFVEKLTGGVQDINKIFTNIKTEEVTELGRALGNLATEGIGALLELLGVEKTDTINEGIGSLSKAINDFATTINGIDFTNGVTKIKNIIWLLEKLIWLADKSVSGYRDIGRLATNYAYQDVDNFPDPRLGPDELAPQMASGGYAGGSWSGDNRFMYGKGEFVMNANATRVFRDELEMMNAIIPADEASIGSRSMGKLAEGGSASFETWRVNKMRSLAAMLSGRDASSFTGTQETPDYYMKRMLLTMLSNNATPQAIYQQASSYVRDNNTVTLAGGNPFFLNYGGFWDKVALEMRRFITSDERATADAFRTGSLFNSLAGSANMYKEIHGTADALYALRNASGGAPVSVSPDGTPYLPYGTGYDDNQTGDGFYNSQGGGFGSTQGSGKIDRSQSWESRYYGDGKPINRGESWESRYYGDGKPIDRSESWESRLYGGATVSNPNGSASPVVSATDAELLGAYNRVLSGFGSVNDYRLASEFVSRKQSNARSANGKNNLDYLKEIGINATSTKSGGSYVFIGEGSLPDSRKTTGWEEWGRVGKPWTLSGTGQMDFGVYSPEDFNFDKFTTEESAPTPPSSETLYNVYSGEKLVIPPEFANRKSAYFSMLGIDPSDYLGSGDVSTQAEFNQFIDAMRVKRSSPPSVTGRLGDSTSIRNEGTSDPVPYGKGYDDLFVGAAEERVKETNWRWGLGFGPSSNEGIAPLKNTISGGIDYESMRNYIFNQTRRNIDTQANNLADALNVANQPDSEILQRAIQEAYYASVQGNNNPPDYDTFFTNLVGTSPAMYPNDATAKYARAARDALKLLNGSLMSAGQGKGLFSSLGDAQRRIPFRDMRYLDDAIKAQYYNGFQNDMSYSAFVNHLLRNFHTGGVASYAGGKRQGYTNELLAVLQDGEEVLTRDDPRHQFNGQRGGYGAHGSSSGNGINTGHKYGGFGSSYGANGRSASGKMSTGKKAGILPPKKAGGIGIFVVSNDAAMGNYIAGLLAESGTDVNAMYERVEDMRNASR